MKVDWQPIADYPGYEVSSDGQVRTLSRKIWIGPSHDGRREYERSRAARMLKPQRASNGYLLVRLPPGRTALIHRLVCQAFNGEPPTARKICPGSNQRLIAHCAVWLGAKVTADTN